MALTIAIEGKGIIANCNALSDSAGGSWSEQGGGTCSVSEDVFFIRSASIGGKYASKSGFHQYDLGSGNELDFTASTGTEAGQLMYIWVSMTAIGTLDTLSTYPLCIRLSSSSPGTSNYIDYLIAGNDDKNGWAGEWKCFAIDPTKTPSRVSGTQSSIIASVRTMGIWIDCSTSARADSIFVNEIVVGSGLRITGTSTVGWQDTIDYCTAYATRGWGMFQEREGIAYTYGKTYIGDTTNQAAAVSFSDNGRKIQFGFTEYCTNAATGTWASSTGTDFSGIYIEDHSSYTTTFNDGISVGTDNGRAGSAFIGNPLMDVVLDLYGGNNTGSVTTLYNTQLERLTGGVIWGNDSDHKFFGGTISGCGQFDPVGAVQIRNVVISGYIGTLGALLWNENIDIQNSAFIANTDVTNNPAAIEHDNSTGSPYDYYDLLFSGNDFDGINTSGTDITVNNNGTSNAANDTGANTITYLSSATLTLTVSDQAASPVGTAYAYIDGDNETPFIMNTTTNASGIASVGHTAGAVTGATWRVRKYGYKPFKVIADVPASGTKEIPVTLIADPQQT